MRFCDTIYLTPPSHEPPLWAVSSANKLQAGSSVLSALRQINLNCVLQRNSVIIHLHDKQFHVRIFIFNFLIFFPLIPCNVSVPGLLSVYRFFYSFFRFLLCLFGFIFYIFIVTEYIVNPQINITMQQVVPYIFVCS